MYLVTVAKGISTIFVIVIALEIHLNATHRLQMRADLKGPQTAMAIIFGLLTVLTIASIWT